MPNNCKRKARSPTRVGDWVLDFGGIAVLTFEGEK